MRTQIDLQYRPTTYFNSRGYDDYLLSKVKGAVVRNHLKAVLDEKAYTDSNEFSDEVSCAIESSRSLESVHPMFMGGNYLPDTDDDEVEIARIDIKSTTHDVTSVYASNDDGLIHYRVVDEYGGDTLQQPDTASAVMPMTLKELVDFFMMAWPLPAILDMNFGDDEESAFDFFSARSDFYPDFCSLICRRVHAHFVYMRRRNAHREMKKSEDS